MPQFLLELYIPRGHADAVERGARAASRAAAALTREGTPVRYLRSIFVPGDETCFYVYEAASVDGVREAAQRAALPYDRIAEAITSNGTPWNTRSVGLYADRLNGDG